MLSAATTTIIIDIISVIDKPQPYFLPTLNLYHHHLPLHSTKKSYTHYHCYFILPPVLESPPTCHQIRHFNLRLFSDFIIKISGTSAPSQPSKAGYHHTNTILCSVLDLHFKISTSSHFLADLINILKFGNFFPTILKMN